MDISNIFASKTRKALFRLYFTNPDGEYYLRELERMLDIPVSMIRRELVRLEEDGIFRSRKRGNQTYYYLNKKYPLFEELKSIVSKTIGIRRLLTKMLERLSNVEVAFIFGSFAKNEARASSDIDVFIIGDVDESKLIEELSTLEKELGREINYSLYTRDDFEKKKKAKESFIEDLLENPKIFLIGNENEL